MIDRTQRLAEIERDLDASERLARFATFPMNLTEEELKALKNRPVPSKHERVLNAALALLEIVEGVRNERWAADGRRLKDTPEWVEFYLAVNPFRR